MSTTHSQNGSQISSPTRRDATPTLSPVHSPSITPNNQTHISPQQSPSIAPTLPTLHVIEFTPYPNPHSPPFLPGPNLSTPSALPNTIKELLSQPNTPSAPSKNSLNPLKFNAYRYSPSSNLDFEILVFNSTANPVVFAISGGQ